MTNKKAPRVVYRHDTITGKKIRIGHLIAGSGLAYLAADMEDVLENMDLARLPALDPSLLSEHVDNDTGEIFYLYRGDIPSHHRG